MKSNNIMTVIIGTLLGIAFLTALISLSTNNINLITGSETEANVTFAEGEYNLSILETYSNAECSNLVITNSTGEEVIEPTGNYTFSSSDCSYTVEATSPYVDETVDLAYDYESEPTGYINNSFARGLIGILLGIFALVILAYLVSHIIKLFEGN